MIDVAIDRAGYQSKKKAGKHYSLGFLHSFYLASLTSGYLWYSSFTAYAANDNSKKKYTIRGLFTFILVELQALLISGPPLCMRKGQSCRV